MTTGSHSLDPVSKRWLTVLAIAMLISIIVLARSFINAFSPPQSVKTDLQSSAQTPSAASTTPATSQWNGPSPFSSSDQQPIHIQSSFKRTESATPQNDAAARKEMVRVQAENLRTMVKQNKLPKSFGNLTLEKIDEMEKNGIIIE